MTWTLLIPTLQAAAAARVTLEWDPSPNAAGYRIHYGLASGAYTWRVDAGDATSVEITGLERGNIYYFAALAYSNNGHESLFSNEVIHTVPAKATQRIQFPQPPDRTAGDAPFPVDAQGGGSRHPVVFTVVSGPASFSAEGLLYLTGTGTVIVRASQPGDEDHLPAPDVERSFMARPLTYAAWGKRHFSAAQLADPALEASLWGKSANPDGDARPNIWEYALGSSPSTFDAEPALSLGLEPGADPVSRHVTLSHTRDRFATDALLVPEVAGAAGEFSATSDRSQESVLPDGRVQVNVLDGVPVTSAAPRRARLALLAAGESAKRYGEIHATRGIAIPPATLSGTTINPKTFYTGAPLVEPLLAAGTVGATGFRTLAPKAALRQENPLAGSGPCYLVLTGGPNAGITTDITGVSGGILSLSDNLHGIALHGDPFAVRRHHTLADVFEKSGAGTLQTGTSGDGVHFLRTNNTEERYLRTDYSGGSRWRNSEGAPGDDRVILPEEAFMIIRRGVSPITLFQQGVITGPGGSQPLIVPVEQGVNLLCLPYFSGSCTLEQSGLHTGNLTTGFSPMLLYSPLGDTVGLAREDGSFSTWFRSSLLLFTGWRSTALEPAGGIALAPGAVLRVHRQGILPAFPWRMPAGG